MSDIVTADGKFLEEFTIRALEERHQASKYKFPREIPTKQDWQVWIQFWN